MFDRFLIFARAKRALSQGQFEVTLRLMSEPVVAGERRAEQLREKALAGMAKRARRRLEDGNLDAARVDVDGVIATAPEFKGAKTLQGEIREEAVRREDEVRVAHNLRKEARQLAERGDLQAAERACTDAAKMQPRGAEQVSVERFIERRQQAVAKDLSSAKAALKTGDLAKLRHNLLRLHAQQDQAEALTGITEKAAGLFAADFVERLKQCSGDGGAAERTLLDEIARERAACPGLLNEPALAKRLDKIGCQRLAEVREELGAGKLAEAVAVFQATHPVLVDSPPLSGVEPGIQSLSKGLDARQRGDLSPALEAMGAASKQLSAKPVLAVLKELIAADARSVEALSRSRELVGQGRLLSAREQIVNVLEEWPMHEPLRRQMDILNQHSLDREERLRRARDLAAEARLAEASALLLGLSGEGEESREARILLQDIHGRMDLAAEGLAQVRRAIHGPSSSREGLRHCVARLDEIAKIQGDLDEVQTVRVALLAEIRGLDLLEAITKSVEVGDLARAKQEIAEYESARGEMLRGDRLEARFLDLADRILHRVDASVCNARLFEAEGWMGVVQCAAKGQSAIESRIESLGSTIESQQGRALQLIEKLEESGVSGDLRDSSELLEEARSIWADCPRLEKLEDRVVVMRNHSNAVDEVERLTVEGDVHGAARKLSSMPPTPGFLRTRIFDIKQGLARAQGLDQGFLLRVDEGGEYLVLRDDSLTIGNVRDAKADVRLLANIAGLHARLKRSLSFHGGMEDRIIAEKGEVFVNGHKVSSAALKSGDRVRLGVALEFVYRVPSKRSLTASLHLKAGFQVAGTDKILLMKDRGRDGRILIGRAEDAHIRVPHDESEVELYSSSDGQIRVHFAAEGDMGGRPFRGSHPVPAGALVRCGDTAFVLQPWHRT